MSNPQYKKWQTKYLIQEYTENKKDLDIGDEDLLKSALKERNIDFKDINQDIRDFYADMRDKYLKKEQEQRGEREND